MSFLISIFVTQNIGFYNICSEGFINMKFANGCTNLQYVVNYLSKNTGIIFVESNTINLNFKYLKYHFFHLII